MSNEIQWGECHNDGCEQPCPWDMACIIMFDEVFCSPDCARDGLEAMPDMPREVALHDPQFAVDREELEVHDERIDLIIDSDAPLAAIECHEYTYPGDFRPFEVGTASE